MRSKIIVTDDNSKTLLIPELNETYHSTKGAITEAKHVFIKEGLLHSGLKKARIFEMGFGTGLNALITHDLAEEHQIEIAYTGIEAFPLTLEQAKEMDYLETLGSKSVEAYEQMHLSENKHSITLNPFFSFTKILGKIEDEALPKNHFDIIYFDAFGPKVQANLWREKVVRQMHDCLLPGGILVTYCAQGAFKRTLKQLGFEVEAIPGPPGKREMTRAIKPK